MDVWIQICSDYHLNSIYIYYCYIWMIGFCYVIMYTISVYCKFMCFYMSTRISLQRPLTLRSVSILLYV